MTSEPSAAAVEIIDQKHPHYGEKGTWAGEVITVLGKPMGKVNLDACRHGMDSCYVEKGQIRAWPR